jgi:hypothetical protein
MMLMAFVMIVTTSSGSDPMVQAKRAKPLVVNPADRHHLQSWCASSLSDGTCESTCHNNVPNLSKLECKLSIV